MMGHICNLSTQEAEGRGLQKGQSYSEIHGDRQANQDFTVRTYSNETKLTQQKSVYTASQHFINIQCAVIPLCRMNVNKLLFVVYSEECLVSLCRLHPQASWMQKSLSSVLKQFILLFERPFLTFLPTIHSTRIIFSFNAPDGDKKEQ